VTTERRGPLRRLEKAIVTAGKYLGLFGTAMKLAQLVPVALGLAVVFFSPTAWLSGTLRRWALVGVLVGSAAGMAAFASLRGRVEDRERFGAGLLLIAVVAAALLRLHLALVDLTFLERWSFLQPLHDLYLGSDLGETLFNVLTALGFAATLFCATLGLPSYLRGRAERRQTETDAAAPGEIGKLKTALASLTSGIDALERRQGALEAENRRLREALVAREREAAPSGPATNGPPGANEAREV
jgi:hypothetical protein